MKVIGVIPARWASKRFEGKVLAPLAGKPMIQHVWERASQCKLIDELLIACDDEKILKASKGFGAKAVLTSPKHCCGTDRIAEVVERMDVDIVVNIQGDEPLVSPESIDALISSMMADEDCLMGTLIKIISNKNELHDPNVVKVVIDSKSNALYFSRALIPFQREPQGDVSYYKHFGIYAFRKNFLFVFKDLPKSNLERIEKLEQLRVIDNGYKIKTVLTDMESMGVDTPEDLKIVENLLR